MSPKLRWQKPVKRQKIVTIEDGGKNIYLKIKNPTRTRIRRIEEDMSMYTHKNLAVVKLKWLGQVKSKEVYQSYLTWFDVKYVHLANQKLYSLILSSENCRSEEVWFAVKCLNWHHGCKNGYIRLVIWFSHHRETLSKSNQANKIKR